MLSARQLSRFARLGSLAFAGGLLALASLSCGGAGQGRAALQPTRGVILISLDTLRADRLGAYGNGRGTSPFFDSLAARGTLFEHVAAPYPATLVSHMSMFTGLYPPQHGVYPPAMVLPDQVWTAAEELRAAGFRTAAHTEGGFVAKGYGFERGFEDFDDSADGGDTDIEATFARGVEFLDGLGPEESFYLFLHSYSVHDPYDPPSRFTDEFDGPDPAPSSGGERLRDFNLGRITIEPDEIGRFSKRYDASVRYVDSVLEDFVTELEGRGLLADTTLVVTSDHGEEFFEHGKLAHTQLYPEVLSVPLLIVHPEQGQGLRVGEQTSLIDVAPTLVELVGQVPPENLSGRSLVPGLLGEEAAELRLAYAEVDDTRFVRTLIGEVDGVRYQLLVEGSKPDVEGVWVAERAELDVFGAALAFRGRSYHQGRTVTVRVDGEVVAELEVTPDWTDFAVDLGGEGLQRVMLEGDGCVSPREAEESHDARCLGFIVQGPPLMAAELFDLDNDPQATVDLSRERSLVTRRMLRELQDASLTAVGGAKVRELSDKDRQRLKDLGYLD